ncbi:MAG: hypothetical protein ACK5HR_02130, partial [Mycoplasmatales bacterium]
ILLLSAPIFRSQAYYNLIGDVQTLDYTSNEANISDEIIPVVDYELAQKLGDKVLGEDLGLGSQFSIGEYYLVSTANDLAWIAPLEPQNFFKWLQNKNTIPGYIYVSATNPNDVKLVQDINGEPLKIQYSEKSFFNKNIKRYAYLQNNFFKGLTDYSFEIDDTGKPYWVVSTYRPTIGFSGLDATGVTVIDEQSGTSNYYTVDDKDLHSWVDRVYPKEMIKQQLTYYGAYKNGWLNSIFTQKEMIRPTSGISYVFVNNKPYFYTGMTSIKSDEATVGFIVRDIKSKNTIFYTLNGATEEAAKSSAQGKVQQYSYSASEPILLDLYNKPTYFMTLKDNDGLVKQYAFVSVENYNIVGIGDDVSSAKKDYYNQLKNNNVLKTQDVSAKKVSGIIQRINYFENFFYLKLQDDTNIYQIDKDLATDLILSQVGDEIELEYIADDSEFKQVTKFNNNSF